MMRKSHVLASLVAIAIAATFVLAPNAPAKEEINGMGMMKPSPAVDLQMAMRKLWEDHITWTRVYIMSSLAGLEDAGAAADRLLKNQDDIGKAIATYYGDKAGSTLAALLREHITIAVDVINAAKSNDTAALDKANQKWHANADAIAKFLAGANPIWKEQDIKDMLYTHLKLTTDQVVARLHKDWKADIEAYDANHDHMLMLSDALTDGIVKQFPEKFER
jgi:hypothetical protein